MRDIILSKLDYLNLRMSYLEENEMPVIPNIALNSDNGNNVFCQEQCVQYGQEISQFLQVYFEKGGFMTLMTNIHLNETKSDWESISVTIMKYREAGIDFMPDCLKEQLEEKAFSKQIPTIY